MSVLKDREAGRSGTTRWGWPRSCYQAHGQWESGPAFLGSRSPPRAPGCPAHSSRPACNPSSPADSHGSLQPPPKQESEELPALCSPFSHSPRSPRARHLPATHRSILPGGPARVAGSWPAPWLRCSGRECEERRERLRERSSPGRSDGSCGAEAGLGVGVPS